MCVVLWGNSLSFSLRFKLYVSCTSDDQGKENAWSCTSFWSFYDIWFWDTLICDYYFWEKCFLNDYGFWLCLKKMKFLSWFLGCYSFLPTIEFLLCMHVPLGLVIDLTSLLAERSCSRLWFMVLMSTGWKFHGITTRSRLTMLTNFDQVLWFFPFLFFLV